MCIPRGENYTGCYYSMEVIVCDLTDEARNSRVK